MFHPAELPQTAKSAAYRLKYDCEARPKLLLGYTGIFLTATL